MISIDEFRRNSIKSAPGQERIRQLSQDVAEAVRATAVTKEPEWDHFLEKIEGLIKVAESALIAEVEVLRHPGTVNIDTIMGTKFKVTVLESRVQTLLDVLALPKQLIEHGRKASETLNAIGE